MNRKNRIYIQSAALGAALAAWTVQSYRRQLINATRRVKMGSQVAETVVGPIEYAVAGHGPAVLISHREGGGYDQGLAFSLLVRGFKCIAPSRSGYLRTPLEVGISPEEQADAFAALLDYLGVKQAAVVGVSAGSPAAVTFALKYPERCWGMILVSSITSPMDSVKRDTDLVYHWMQRSDFLAWVLNGLGFRAVQVLNGGDTEAWQAVRQNHMSSTILYAYLATSPIRLRRRGMHNDEGQIEHLRTLPLEAITTPTMVLHGAMDPVVPASQARSAAGRIPNANYLEIHGGGHLAALTHRDVAAPAMVEFLNAHAPEG